MPPESTNNFLSYLPSAGAFPENENLSPLGTRGHFSWYHPTSPPAHAGDLAKYGPLVENFSDNDPFQSHIVTILSQNAMWLANGRRYSGSITGANSLVREPGPAYWSGWQCAWASHRSACSSEVIFGGFPGTASHLARVSVAFPPTYSSSSSLLALFPWLTV